MNPEATLEDRYLELLRRNRARIDRLCRAWSRTAADREDLRSEVLLQLWRSLPGFDGRAREDTWLYRVALNTAMLFRRGEGHREKKLESLERQPQVGPSPPDEQVLASERLERLTDAISRLEPADRALITLQLEDLPYRQIAEVTGLGESHVGVRLHRIRKKLARLIAGGQEADHGQA